MFRCKLHFASILHVGLGKPSSKPTLSRVAGNIRIVSRPFSISLSIPILVRKQLTGLHKPTIGSFLCTNLKSHELTAYPFIALRQYHINEHRNERILGKSEDNTRSGIDSLINSGMTRMRTISWGPIQSPVFSISEITGHLSFLFLAFGYLTTEVLYLRAYAFSGIIMSILFQYYREKPLWIPIKWNMLFLFINGIMIGLILKEQFDAENIPLEHKQVYEKKFQDQFMAPVDFKKLMAISTRRELKRGDKIVCENKVNNNISIIISGRVLLEKNSKPMCEVWPWQFLGIMSFKNWEGKFEIEKKVKRKKAKEFDLWSGGNDFSGIEIINSWLDLLRILTYSEDQSQLDREFLQNTRLTGLNDEEPTKVVEEMGYASAICQTDVVVYSWNFEKLYHLMAHHPGVSAVIHKAMGQDVNNKLALSVSNEPKYRYQEVLKGVLSDSYVTDEERRTLDEIGTACKITLEEKRQYVEHLGWTMSEYERGFKAVDAQAHTQYRAKIKEEIDKSNSNNEQMDASVRKSLLEFRKKYKISRVEHEDALKINGWTLEDYEIGMKANMANSVEQPKPKSKWSFSY